MPEKWGSSREVTGYNITKATTLQQLIPSRECLSFTAFIFVLKDGPRNTRKGNGSQIGSHAAGTKDLQATAKTEKPKANQVTQRMTENSAFG